MADSVIRTVVAHQTALLRGALMVLLANHDDIEVAAEYDGAADLEATLGRWQPDVTVIDLGILDLIGVQRIDRLLRRLPACSMLALVHAGSSRASMVPLARLGRRVGFIGEDAAPAALVEAVRRSARGEHVVDPGLITLLVTPSPLTPREVEVLRATAEGHPLRVVASRLSLSHGTVRNCLSAIYTKTGARTRIHAIRIARQAGWI